MTPLQHRLTEGVACYSLMLMLLGVRWEDPRDPGLDPHHGAKVLADGWPQFRIDFVKDMNEIRSVAPDLIGKINFDRSARHCWRLLRARLTNWWLRAGGTIPKHRRYVEPRVVIEAFEKYYVPPRKKPPLSESVIEMEITGKNAGLVDGFRSSGMKREGTIRQIIEDIANDGQRRRTHELVDELEAEEAARG